MLRGLRTTIGLLLALAAGACGDGVLEEQSGRPVGITVLLPQQGGAPQAFDAVDNLGVEVVGGGETLFSQSLPIASTSTGIRSSIEVRLAEGAVDARVSVTLRRGSDGLFTGFDDIELTPGADTQATIQLTPVVARLELTPPPLFTVFGQIADLEGFAAFATGDRIPGGDVVWTSLDPNVVEVERTSDGGYVARALADGAAVLQGAFEGNAATVAAQVEAVVTSVEVTPPSATLVPGGTLDLVATMRDAGQGIITSRSPVWASSDESVATVSTTGTVTAIAPGAADITASRDGAAGSANVLVRLPGPGVTTLPAEMLTGSGGTLRALIDPRGSTTSVVFEYGTTSDLSDAATTPATSVPGSVGPTAVIHPVSGFSAGTLIYFRAVATNASGSASGDIVSFRTTDPPSAPSGLTATFVGGQTASVELTWQDNSTNETRFEIERELQGGVGAPPAIPLARAPLAVFQPAGTVAADVTLFRDIPPTGDLRFRVRACNADGCSPWAGPLDWTFGQRPLVLTLAATNVSDDSAQLPAFVNPLNAPTTIVWQLGMEPTFTTPPPTTFPTTPLSAGSGRIDVSRSTSVSGLSPGGTYYVRAVATNYWGVTFGNVISFTTILPG